MPWITHDRDCRAVWTGYQEACTCGADKLGSSIPTSVVQQMTFLKIGDHVVKDRRADGPQSIRGMVDRLMAADGNKTPEYRRKDVTEVLVDILKYEKQQWELQKAEELKEDESWATTANNFVDRLYNAVIQPTGISKGRIKVVLFEALMWQREHVWAEIKAQKPEVVQSIAQSEKEKVAEMYKIVEEGKEARRKGILQVRTSPVSAMLRSIGWVQEDLRQSLMNYNPAYGYEQRQRDAEADKGACDVKPKTREGG